MDRKHKLSTPNNDALGLIEQLEDRSGLSTLYPTAKGQWSGELLTTQQREEKRNKESSAFMRGILIHFVSVGMLIPIPLILAALLGVFLVAISNLDKPEYWVFPLMIAFGIWVGVTYLCLRKLYAIFYDHSLRATPYLLFHVVLLGLALQAVYLGIAPLISESLFYAVSSLSVFAFVISTSLSLLLLTLWTQPSLSGNAKVGIVGALAVGLVGLIAWLALA